MAEAAGVHTAWVPPRWMCSLSLWEHRGGNSVWDLQEASQESCHLTWLLKEERAGVIRSGEGILVKGTAQAKAQQGEAAWQPLQVISTTSLQIRRLAGRGGAEKSAWTHPKGLIITLRCLIFSYRLWEQRCNMDCFIGIFPPFIKDIIERGAETVSETLVTTLL